MRAATSFLVIGGALAALGAGGVATAALAARVKPAPAPVVETPPASIPAVRQTDIDAERRARLSARMNHMVREGRGGRLADPVARTAARPAARAAAPAPRPARAALAAPVAEPARDRPESSTIRPPAVDPARASYQPAGGRYVAPRLDLKTAPVVPADPIECLTQAIYYEARNESEEGQMAVAEVVLNRSRHGAYPRDVCQVVYQRNSRTCQFTFTCDGSIGRRAVNMTAWARAERLAREAYGGGGRKLLPANSVNYHANYVRPSWGARLNRVRQIGAHIFYGAPLPGARNPGAGEPAEAGPRPSQGLMFVRNEALDRAYAALQGGDAS